MILFSYSLYKLNSCTLCLPIFLSLILSYFLLSRFLSQSRIVCPIQHSSHLWYLLISFILGVSLVVTSNKQRDNAYTFFFISLLSFICYQTMNSSPFPSCNICRCLNLIAINNTLTQKPQGGFPHLLDCSLRNLTKNNSDFFVFSNLAVFEGLWYLYKALMFIFISECFNLPTFLVH